jgi:sugar (pentulose or hexulose) kinase
MTGVAVTDPASGPDGDWDSGWLAAADLAPDQVPAVKLPWTIAGTLTKVAARELGLIEGTPVAVGAHDGICANTGAGAISEGTMAITLGTNCVARMVMRDVPAGSMRFYGYPQDLHVIGGNALMAGRSLDWFLDVFPNTVPDTAPDTVPDKGPDEHLTREANRRQLFRTLDHAIGDMKPGAGGVMFLPHLGGQLSPTRRPKAKALFYGMDANTTHAAMYRAVLEGVNLAIADVVDQVVSWCGAPSRIGITGSGMQSEVWTHMLADILGRPLELTDAASEGRGAAIFCATALGHYPSLKDATVNMVNVTRTIEPDGHNALVYHELRLRWQSLQHLTAPLDGI